MFGRSTKEQGKFRHFKQIFFWSMIGGLIATLIGLIPLIILKACCNFNFGYVFWIFLATTVSGALSLLAFELISRRVRRPKPFRANEQVEYYKEIEDDWKNDPELIKVNKKYHPAIYFVFILATFGIIANFLISTLYVLTKYNIEIPGFAFFGWIGIVAILASVGGAFWIRQISDISDFTESMKNK